AIRTAAARPALGLPRARLASALGDLGRGRWFVCGRQRCWRYDHRACWRQPDVGVPSVGPPAILATCLLGQLAGVLRMAIGELPMVGRPAFLAQTRPARRWSPVLAGASLRGRCGAPRPRSPG